MVKRMMGNDISKIAKQETLDPPLPAPNKNTNSTIHRQIALRDIQKSVEGLLHPKHAQNQIHPS